MLCRWEGGVVICIKVCIIWDVLGVPHELHSPLHPLFLCIATPTMTATPTTTPTMTTMPHPPPHPKATSMWPSHSPMVPVLGSSMQQSLAPTS